jgi:hypothetical protein
MAHKADLMETIAVYWEPKIKTYGMVPKTGLTLVSMTLPMTDTTAVLRNLRSRADLAEGLLMITASPCAEGRLKTDLVLAPPAHPSHQQVLIDGQASGVDPDAFRIQKDVEMVYFHGPHYGDRYGIAHRVFGALIAHKVALLASACSASSIYLVVPRGAAGAVCQALADDVVVPQVAPRT